MAEKKLNSSKRKITNPKIKFVKFCFVKNRDVLGRKGINLEHSTVFLW